jgi:hypothetical protein
LSAAVSRWPAPRHLVRISPIWQTPVTFLFLTLNRYHLQFLNLPLNPSLSKWLKATFAHVLAVAAPLLLQFCRHQRLPLRARANKRPACLRSLPRLHLGLLTTLGCICATRRVRPLSALLTTRTAQRQISTRFPLC